jgi:antitoxin ParD1/3/4
MGRNTSVILSDHFNRFIEEQVGAGHYGSASEVVRAGLRLLEERETRLEALRRALIEGEESGSAGPLDMEEIKRAARAMAARAA